MLASRCPVSQHSFVKASAPRRTVAPKVQCSAAPDNREGVGARAAQAAGGLLLSAALLLAQPASAELNKYEFDMGGEFGKG